MTAEEINKKVEAEAISKLISKKEALEHQIAILNAELHKKGIKTESDERKWKEFYKKDKEEQAELRKKYEEEKDKESTTLSSDSSKSSESNEEKVSKEPFVYSRVKSFNYQQFADNYNVTHKTNTTAEYWEKEFNVKKPPRTKPVPKPKPSYDPFDKPDTSYSNTHKPEKFSTGDSTKSTNSSNTSNSSNTNSSNNYGTYGTSYTNYNDYFNNFFSKPQKPAPQPTSVPRRTPPSYTPFTQKPQSPPISPEMKNPKDMCNSRSTYPADTLSSRKILTKEDWKKWLKQNHVDKGGDATICGHVIAAGRNQGW